MIAPIPSVTILMYHRVDPDPGQELGRWGVTPRQFEEQMRALFEGRYRVLTLSEVVEVVRGTRPAPVKAVALTFDDGYQSLLEHALPVLDRYRFPATFFLVSDRVGGTNSWDASAIDPPRSLMNWREAATLTSRGHCIGAHGKTHRRLPGLPDRELEEEIRGSKETIEDRLGLLVRFFSYPHGFHDDRCRERVASAGYQAACSSDSGRNGVGRDPIRLRRSEIIDHETAWSFSFKLRTGFGAREWWASRMNGLHRRLRWASGRTSAGVAPVVDVGRPPAAFPRAETHQGGSES